MTNKESELDVITGNADSLGKFKETAPTRQETLERAE